MAKRTTVNVHEAKTHLSRLLERVAAGDEVIIAKAGKPVARLVPVASPGKRPLGIDAGKGWIADDFNAPLPDDVLDDFSSDESAPRHGMLALDGAHARTPVGVDPRAR